MTNLKAKKLNHTEWPDEALVEINPELERMHSVGRIEWALKNLPQNFALSSSFGIQSAVSLHMVTQVYPEIPVILVDTGYLFPETYQFIEQLRHRLNLNLKVFRSDKSSAWQEALNGKLWQKGESELKQYNQINKVEPMEFGLQQLQVESWFAGIMRSQSTSRAFTPVLQRIRGRLKIHPIIDWNKQKIHLYLKQHQLPYHPLWEQGFVSVGDVHSSSPLQAGMNDEDTRFGGVLRECGLHEDTLSGL